MRFQRKVGGIFSHTDVGSSAGREAPVLISNHCNPAGWQTLNSEHGPSPFLRSKVQRGKAPLFIEQHCLAEQPTRQGRVDVVHGCLHFQASSGPPSGRTMGLCLACVGVHAIDDAGMLAAVQIVESNQHSDLSATLHCSTPSLWKSLLFFHSKSGKFEEMKSTLAG